MQTELGIKGYIRYADNLLFALKGAECAGPLKSLLGSEGVYRGKLGEESSVGLTMLNLYNYKDARVNLERRLSYRPLLKARGPYIAPRSSHAVSIHRSWPEAYLRSLRSLSSTVDGSVWQSLNYYAVYGMWASRDNTWRTLIECRHWYLLHVGTLRTASKRAALELQSQARL